MCSIFVRLHKNWILRKWKVKFDGKAVRWKIKVRANSFRSHCNLASMDTVNNLLVLCKHNIHLFASVNLQVSRDRWTTVYIESLAHELHCGYDAAFGKQLSRYLRTIVTSLDPAREIGLEYYDSFGWSIPRHRNTEVSPRMECHFIDIIFPFRLVVQPPLDLLVTGSSVIGPRTCSPE